MATIDIGKLTFTHKGDYASGTAYVLNDVVYYNGSAYIAKQSTTGNVPTNTTYWSTFTAGSGGIWNSGLSIGSAGQVVKVNSGASALEFGTVSSDYVKLGSVTASASGVVTFDNLFTSDYKVYKIFIKRAHGSTDNSSIRVRYRGGGSQLTGSVYKNFHQGGYFSSSSNTSVLNRSWNGDHHNLTLNGLDNNVQHGLTGEYTLFDPQASDVRKNHICHMVHNVYDQTLFWNYTSAGAYDDTTVLTGIEFYMNTGNISGIFTLYGIKE